MHFLKFLHAVNQCLHTFYRYGIVARSTETTHRTVTLDAHHTFFGSELQEVGFQVLVFIGHDEADVHVRTVFLGRYGATEQLVAVNFGIQHVGTLFGTALHFFHATLCLNPAQSLESRINRVNEGELETLAALAKDNALQVRFIEMMPIGYGAAMPCISGPELRARFARRWPELAPLSTAQEHALGDGPAVYYTVPGWQGSIGFIAAVHGKFCASCNRVRLTSQGFLRPCLASETGCDLRALLRSGADDAQLLAAIRETIWAKPREHHFNDSSMPATRGMYRIGG